MKPQPRGTFKIQQNPNNVKDNKETADRRDKDWPTPQSSLQIQQNPSSSNKTIYNTNSETKTQTQAQNNFQSQAHNSNLKQIQQNQSQASIVSNNSNKYRRQRGRDRENERERDRERDGDRDRERDRDNKNRDRDTSRDVNQKRVLKADNPQVPTILGAKSASSREGNVLLRSGDSNSQHPVPGANIKILSGTGGLGPSMSNLDKDFLRNRPQFETGKLLNEHLEFCMENVAKIVSDQTDFTVIGVIGPQGVGKSTLLSQLNNYGYSTSTSTTSTTTSTSSQVNVHSPFSIGNEDTLLSSRHNTNGIDFSVNSDRLILLDVQPIFSASILTQMIKNEIKLPNSLTTDIVSYENLHDLQCYQLGVFLLSVCHVVIVVQDWVCDLNISNYIRTLEMLKFTIPDVSMISSEVASTSSSGSGSGGGSGGGSGSGSGSISVSGSSTGSGSSINEVEYYPDLYFVFTKVPEEYLTDTSLNSLKTIVDRFIPEKLKPTQAQGQSELNKKSKIERNEESNRNHNHYHNHVIDHNEEVQSYPNIIFLPTNTDINESSESLGEKLRSQSSEINLYSSSYQAASNKLNQKLLSHKKRNFQKQISEREWLRNASKIWDLIRKSSFINDYNKTLLKMNTYKTC